MQVAVHIMNTGNAIELAWDPMPGSEYRIVSRSPETPSDWVIVTETRALAARVGAEFAGDADSCSESIVLNKRLLCLK